MKWSIEKQTLVGFSVVSLVLVCTNVLSYWGFIRYKETSAWVTHTRQILHKLETTLTNLKEAETGQRGYVITGRESYLEPYETAVATVNQRIQEIRKLTADNPSQQQRLNKVEPLIAKKLALMNQLIELRRNQGFAAAQQLILTDRGKVLTDRIQQLMREMKNEENQLLEERLEQEQVTVTLETIVYSTGVVLDLCLLCLIYFALQQENTKRQQAQMAVEMANEQLVGTIFDLRVVNQQLQGEVQAREQAQQAMSESEERYRQLVELSPDAIFIQSGGQLIFVNSAAVRLFGATSPDELIGVRILDLIHPDYREDVEQRIQQLSKGCCTARVEDKFLRLDGTVVDVEVVAIPFTYQSQPAAQVIAHDISGRKRVDEELRKTLEKERELSQLKSRIITTISHEYRTPLTTIQSSAELLENYAHKLTEEKRLTHLHRIQRNTRRMTSLVSEVLFISQAEADKLEFNPTLLHLESFCRELVEEMQLSANGQTTISFYSRGGLTDAYLDEKLLRQILTNLLSNAIKYSLEDGTVQFALEHSEGMAQFQIQDEGIGIPVEDQLSLFESFYRGSNVGTLPGTGLGLAIVKKCVDLQGGQITVESVVNQGTTFTVRLPLNSSTSTQ